MSTEPVKAKSREPAYSQVLNQNKIDRQRVKIQRVRQAGRQADRPSDGCDIMVFGVETRREVWGRGWIRIGFAKKKQCFQCGVKKLKRDGKR